MQAFMIYRGDKPLIWSTDGDTQAHTEVTECFFTFPSREIANRVMAEVPSLFDLDEDDAENLSVREIDIPV
jgi:hypothetical protein